MPTPLRRMHTEEESEVVLVGLGKLLYHRIPRVRLSSPESGNGGSAAPLAIIPRCKFQQLSHFRVILLFPGFAFCGLEVAVMSVLR